jgi:hypothetical protein
VDTDLSGCSADQKLPDPTLMSLGDWSMNQERRGEVPSTRFSDKYELYPRLPSGHNRAVGQAKEHLASQIQCKYRRYQYQDDQAHRR